MNDSERVAGIQPLIATDNADLLDDLLRLSAAAGVEPRVATTLGALRSRWNRQQLVLLGADFAAEFSRGFVPRRESVILVAPETTDSRQIWQDAAHIGVEQVAFLPGGEPWLIERIAAVESRGVRRAPTVGFVGGSGGVGASVFTTGVAHVCQFRDLTPVAIDLDPIGAGLDVLLGSDLVDGFGWPDFAAARGRIRSAQLRQKLASTNGVPHVVFGTGERECHLDEGVVGAVIDALTMCSGMLCVDLPRAPAPGIADATCRLDLLVVLVGRDTPSVLSTVHLLRGDQWRDVPTQIVVTGPRSSPVSAHEIANSLGLPLLCELAPEGAVTRLIEQARPPVRRRSGLYRACETVIQAALLAAADRRSEAVA